MFIWYNFLKMSFYFKNMYLIYIYIYIYIIETFEAPTIFHVSTVFKKQKKKKENTFLKPDFAFTLHGTVHSIPAFHLPAPP